MIQNALPHISLQMFRSDIRDPQRISKFASSCSKTLPLLCRRARFKNWTFGRLKIDRPKNGPFHRVRLVPTSDRAVGPLGARLLALACFLLINITTVS